MPERRRRYVYWTSEDDRALKAHSRSRTPVAKISRELKRTEGAIRQRAHNMGLSIGHQRRSG